MLLLLAMLRAVGFRAKLVSSLHPPPRSAPKGKAAQAAGGKSGKAAAEARRAAHDHALHVPLWCEVFLPGAARWAALDGLAPARLLCAHPADAMRARCPPKVWLGLGLGIGLAEELGLGSP